jgi:[ribosomal protein S18]-alanine N-acetyltransferase
MTADDLPVVAAIEWEASLHPWSPNVIKGELQMPLARNLVAVSGEKVIGYLGFWLVAGEAQIQNIFVQRDFRGRGVASGLLAALRDISVSEGATAATLEVRSQNEGAIALYGKNGFVVQGVRRKYYDDGDDALLMGRDL